MRNVFILAMLWLCAPLWAQVPPPQLNLTGNIGAIGFPVLNSGTYQMTGDSNFTLSSSNVNTSAVSIKITSSTALTATRTITYPAGNFLLNVENATAGGHSITIAGPTGTGVTIPNGSSVWIWYDGTNYVSSGGITLGTTYIPAGTAQTVIAGLSMVTIDLGSNPNAGLDLTGSSTYGTPFVQTDKNLGNTWYLAVEGTNETNFIGDYCITTDSSRATCDLAIASSGIVPKHIYSQNNCIYVGSPAVCGNATGGIAIIYAGTLSEVINTTAVGVNSHIRVNLDESLGPSYGGGVTCNTTAGQGTASLYVSARTSGTSFTVSSTATSIATNPVCLSWDITD